MKKSILVLLVLLLTVGFSVSAANDNVAVNLQGTINQILQLHFSTPNDTEAKSYDWNFGTAFVEGDSISYTDLNSATYSTGITVYERSNRSSAYAVSVDSTNGFVLSNGDENLVYTLTYGSATVSADGNVTTGGTKTSGTGVGRDISITMDNDFTNDDPLPEEGVYTDTLTFTIAME